MTDRSKREGVRGKREEGRSKNESSERYTFFAASFFRTIRLQVLQECPPYPD